MVYVLTAILTALAIMALVLVPLFLPAAISERRAMRAAQAPVPMLNGVPLPSWNDERWEKVFDGCRLEGFRVDRDCVYLHREGVGTWPLYVRLVTEHVRERGEKKRLAELADRALQELEKS